MESQGGASPHAAAEQGAGAIATPVVAPAPGGLPAFGHAEFSGFYEGRIEANGRLVLPSAFRYAFAPGDPVVVRAQDDDHIALTSRAGFNQMIDAVIAKQPDMVIDARLRADAYALAPKVTIDRQYRLVLPPQARDQVPLDDDIVFVGAIEAIKVMTPERGAALVERASMLNRLLDSWGGLPTDPA